MQIGQIGQTGTFSSDENELCREVLAGRIREKMADYDRYDFSTLQSCALNIFFDLAQEYEDIIYLYHLPVKILRLFFSMHAEFYSREGDGFVLRTTRQHHDSCSLPSLDELAASPLSKDDRCYCVARGHIPHGAAAQRATDGDAQSDESDTVLGLLVLYPAAPLDGHDLLYYQKFANRLGFCLKNKMLARKNSEHIRFVRNLVHDIGHNVIGPNLYFKLLIRQMEGKLKALGDVCDKLSKDPGQETVQDLAHLHTRIEEQYHEIAKHFQQSSFFLETLLRQSHFDQGQYVLNKTTVDLVQRIVAPQLERYCGRFEEKNITVALECPLVHEDTLLVDADIGLLSQVLANLFSNATKYTRANPGAEGLKMRCKVERIPCFFDNKYDAACVSVCTSGEPIAEHETPHLFTESFRASNTQGEYGTGHGLHFIQLIIEQHNGRVRYSREEEGNVFSFMVPCAA